MGLPQLAGDLLGLHHAGAAGGEGLFLFWLGRELGQLLVGVAQIVGVLARLGDSLLLRRQIRPRLAPGGPGLAGGGEFSGEPTKGVDERAVLGGVDEGAVVVLAVDLHQRRADLAHGLDADGLVIDEGAGAAISHLHAPQDQIAIYDDVMAFCDDQRGMAQRQIKGRRHLALRLPLAHEGAIAPAAQRQRESVQQDRLAGAGFARENHEPRPQLQIQPIDQNYVTDRELGEHGSAGSTEAEFLEALGDPGAAVFIGLQSATLEQRESVLVPLTVRVVVPEHRRRRLRLVGDA